MSSEAPVARSRAGRGRQRRRSGDRHRSIRDAGDAGRRKVVEAVRHVQHVGFFVITGHGVAAKIRAILKQPRFLCPPGEEKMRIRRPGPGISRGYNAWPGKA